MIECSTRLANVREMKVLLVSGIMYGGAWRRNYNVLRSMRKVHGKVDYTLLLESHAMKLVPNIDRMIAELREQYQLRFFKGPAYLRFTPLHYVYMNKLSKMMKDIAKEEKVDLILVAHEVDWWILSAKNSSQNALPWTCLLQSMPLFGCLSELSSSGILSTLTRTPPIAYKAHKKIRGIYRYFRLQLLVRALEETLSLSVSKSITRDMKTLFPWLNMRTLMPGVGIDLGYLRSISASPKSYDAVYFTSELMPHKGFLELPEIWKDVVRSMPEARLLVIGKGQQPYLRRFSELIERLDVRKNIVLRGLLPHDELISLVKASKVMVYPSVYDSFSLVVLESLASGVPVVAYDMPFIRANYMTRSVVKCPKNDKKCLATNIVKLLSDEDQRRDLSREAVKYAEKFTWENVAREELKAYYKVLDYWSST